MPLQRPALEIDQPGLGDPLASVEWQRRAAILGKRTVRDLDEQEDVRRHRVALGVKVVTRAEHGDIRLRLAIGAELHRILHTNYRPITELPMTEGGEALDTTRVR